MIRLFCLSIVTYDCYQTQKDTGISNLTDHYRQYNQPITNKQITQWTNQRSKWKREARAKRGEIGTRLQARENAGKPSHIVFGLARGWLTKQTYICSDWEDHITF